MSALIPSVGLVVVAESARFAGWTNPPYSSVLLGVILLAGAGTTTLFALGVVAYRRRASRPYLYVVSALGLLVARTIVGLGTLFAVVPMYAHHLVEHSFDFFIAVLLLVAIYAQRSDAAN